MPRGGIGLWPGAETLADPRAEILAEGLSPGQLSRSVQTTGLGWDEFPQKPGSFSPHLAGPRSTAPQTTGRSSSARWWCSRCCWRSPSW